MDPEIYRMVTISNQETFHIESVFSSIGNRYVLYEHEKAIPMIRVWFAVCRNEVILKKKMT